MVATRTALDDFKELSRNFIGRIYHEFKEAYVFIGIGKSSLDNFKEEYILFYNLTTSESAIRVLRDLEHMFRINPEDLSQEEAKVLESIVKHIVV